jgi:hypothetical protein
MPKMRKKSDLPQNICGACGRPFSWRRKWARDWDQVKTCSDRCRGELRRKDPATDNVLALRSVRAPSGLGREFVTTRIKA